MSQTLKPLAVKFKGKVNFATIDAKAFGAHAGNLNLDPEKFPAFAIQETVKNQKFPFDQSKKLTEEDIGIFVQDFVDGKVEPSIKSEPIPDTQDGPVEVVVAHNYEEVVINNNKDVLVEFYAPWCGHCKAYVPSSFCNPMSQPERNERKLKLTTPSSLAPKYEELANLYFTNLEYSERVSITKVDATANDVPDEIQGFPTIKIFPAGRKLEPVTYSGSRTIEDLVAFIKEHGTHKIDAYEGKNETGAGEQKEEKAAESVGEAAAAATEGVKDKVTSVVKEAVESAKAVVQDSDDEVHDEL